VSTSDRARLAVDYAILREDVARIDGAAVPIRVVGPDAGRFLQGLLSADVAAVSPGGAVRTLLLEPRGKLRAHGHLLGVDENDYLLVVDAPVGERTVADLLAFRFRVEVTVAPVEETSTVLWGPAARRRAGLDGLPPGAVRRTGDGLVADLAPVHDGAAVKVLAVGGVAGTVDVPTVMAEAATAVRIEAGEPVVGVDVDDDTIPQEAGLVDGAVSFTKGCYLGQELVARIDARGHVNRRLRGVVVDGPERPATGTVLTHGGRAVGSLTSVAYSPGLDAWVGLGLLRTEVAPDSEVAVGGAEAPGRVRELPLR